MISTLKNFLLIAFKNAVNALLVDSALMATLPGVFHMHSADGWINLAKAAGGVILSREVVVWGPILLKWSTTNADPNVQVIQQPNPAPNIIEPKPKQP